MQKEEDALENGSKIIATKNNNECMKINGKTEKWWKHFVKTIDPI